MLGFLGRVGLHFYSSTSLWTPALLFAAGEPGVWYDPSDFSTMFQDSAGTTPVTAVEQPVGLLLDKSKGLALGSELVTNGDFSSGTGWTLQSGQSITGGELVFTASSGVAGRTDTFANNATHKVTIVITSYTAGDVQISINGGSFMEFDITGPGTYTRYIRAGNTTTNLYIAAAGGASTWAMTSISVRELPGNHASQSTAASRPVLSARVNLLTRTEEFDNAAWTKGNLVTTGMANVTATTDPLGGNTADKLQETATTAEHFAYQGPVTLAAAQHTASAYFKAAERTWATLQFSTGPISATWFNLASDGTGVPGTVASGCTAASTYVGNGWYRCSVTRTTTAGTWYVVANPSLGDGISPIYGGTLNSGIYIWGADLRVTNVGSNMPAYQRVGAATYGTSTVAGNPDYDTSGFPFFLAFNGVTGSRWMVSSTITPGTDKAQVFAGARKLSDAETGMLTELSISASTNNGAFDITAPNGTGFGFELKGNSPSTYYTPQGFASPTTNVLTGLFNIGGAERATEVIPRVNGILAQSGAGGGSDTGTGDFNAYPLYIGARAGSGFYYNGNLYSLIVRFGTNLPESTIDQTEVWVGDKTGLNLSFATQQTIFDRFNATVLDRAGATILQRY